MSEYAEAMDRVKRERETEARVRSMDTHEIVDFIHGIEDAIEGLIEDKADLDGALDRLIGLHVSEQEGISSGMPTPEQWINAVDDAAEALARARGES